MPYSLSPEKMTYGYIWSDWLYGTDKDSFMVDVYDECKRIDECADPADRAARLAALGDRVRESRKPWVEGIFDFIDFETSCLSEGKPPVPEIYDSNESFQALGVIQAAYLHGAFKGLCRTASGEEWIGALGEWCGAALHQGMKAMRPSGVSEWELPTLGEHWCKGVSMWALCCMYAAVDVAGDDPDNDEALARIHAVIGAHHVAGACWLKYRGAHPHKWFDPEARPVAPRMEDIRRFGERYGYPIEMVEVMCRAADHVNTWSNPPSSSVHLDRTRDLLIADYTPRLESRIDEVCKEMYKFADDVTSSEEAEIRSRSYKWMVGFTSRWRGRGDMNDSVLEVHMPGAVLGVLRESRSHVEAVFADRWIEWADKRIAHLPAGDRTELLGLVRRTVEVRGRLPGISDGYSGSAGTGPLRWIDGVWPLAIMSTMLGSSVPERNVDEKFHETIIRFFNAYTGAKRIEGVDKPPGAAGEGCPVCLGDRIFEGLVIDRCTAPVSQIFFWGTLLYINLGLGRPDDNALGSRAGSDALVGE